MQNYSVADAVLGDIAVYRIFWTVIGCYLFREYMRSRMVHWAQF